MKGRLDAMQSNIKMHAHFTVKTVHEVVLGPG